MRLPNKVTPFKSSVISLFPIILNTLIQNDMSPKDLLEITKSKTYKNEKSLADFLSALDCLFALGKIELTKEGGMLKYVNHDSV
ncbi:ABC-three component system middle component 7 [Globicatella sulfidifaciens]|uniref:Uncharacterized protein n=1 Tax=Globicatella sulfidifaciens TaxID=136093 RepID=A0A7X8H123_9LACT|nr:ABC-three component system middle component 7 [Globicatella sulfidifaciens]NLJ19454.1 hypothetical protein [Globicatella sulfidifaciens]